MKLTHSLTQKINRLSRLMLLFYAPFFKNTPSESLEILYNHLPPIVEILKVGMSMQCRIIDSLPNRWNGIGTTIDGFKGFLLTWNRACKKNWMARW